LRDDGLLKISELAERSGVSSGTIKHYLREGLLPEPVKTSRNMAYYPEDFVERIRLIKRLQEERFLPLRHIKEVLAEVGAGEDGDRMTRSDAARLHGIPENVLERLEGLGVLSGDGYGADDVRIVAAIARFRAGGYDERLGFTVYDTLRYRDALAPLVEEEVATLLERLAGEVPVERAVEIIQSGAEPLRELIGAMHSRMLQEELSLRSSGQRRPDDAARHRGRGPDVPRRALPSSRRA
jgi:DNA-binding transcriptional MerR regulator